MQGSGIRPARPKLLIIGVIVLVVVLAGAAGFFFWQYTHLKNGSSTQETTQRLVSKVGAIYELPSDEQPTVAQVQDKEKLKDQTFFAKAQNGDYILIFTNAKLALLYREKSHKLINVGPIALPEGQAAGVQTKN